MKRLNVWLKAFALLALLSAAALPGALPGLALAQTADPERLAAAKALLDAAGTAKQFDTVVPLISQQIEAAFTQLKPEYAAQIKEAFGRIPEKFSARKQELLDQIAELYAQHLTAPELDEIAKFYKSPVGMKFVSLQATLAQQSMLLGRTWGQKIGQEIEQEIRENLKQKGIQL
jgi:hypothetical protein